jgi:hypothetical protein
VVANHAVSLRGDAIANTQRQPPLAPEREKRVVDRSARASAGSVDNPCHTAAAENGKIRSKAVLRFPLLRGADPGKQTGKRTDVSKYLACGPALRIALDFYSGKRRPFLVEPKRLHAFVVEQRKVVKVLHVSRVVRDCLVELLDTRARRSANCSGAHDPATATHLPGPFLDAADLSASNAATKVVASYQ